MNWRTRTLSLLLFITTGQACSGAMNMRVFQINDYLLSFYEGRPVEPSRHPLVETGADVDRISTQRAIQLLTVKKAAIEAGTVWGPPAVKPLVIPNIGITAETNYYVGDIRVELRPVHIHSEDWMLIDDSKSAGVASD